MTNILRGEVDIKLRNKKFTIRPTFQALCEIEGEVGKSLWYLIANFPERGLLLQEQVTIIKAGIKAAGEEVPEDLAEQIQQAGFIEILPKIFKFLESGLKL